MYPKFSVIIPVYNKEKYLDECIESILKQSYDNYEIIIIDDGSTDSSLLKCEHWAKKENRITVFHKKNEGPALARNLGLDKATGEIISFVDADDYLDMETYMICSKEMTESGADACYFGRRAVTDGKVVNNVLQIPEKLVFNESMIKSEFIKFMIGTLVDEEPRNYVGVSTCTVVYKREFLEQNKIRFVDVRQNEDPIFNIIVCKYAKKILVLPDILYNNTVGFQSLTRKYDSTRFEVFKQGYVETIKFAQCFPECDNGLYRMKYRFLSNVCRDIQMEMRYAKENGYLTALRHIRMICWDKLVHEVAIEIVDSSVKSKRMVLIKLIRYRQSLLIWGYHVAKEIRSKCKRFIRKIKSSK